MKTHLVSTLLCAGLALCGLGAHAEKADRNKPMNFEADAAGFDDVKQLSVLTGRVVLTKGTILIRGARMEVREDEQGNQFGLVTAAPGELAFFRQKREGVDEYIEGEGESIDYDGRADTVKFIGKGQLRRFRGAVLSDEFNAGVIVYNNTTGVFTLEGAPKPGKSGSVGQPGAPAGRVRAMLTPKAGAAPAVSAPTSTPLRATPELESGTP